MDVWTTGFTYRGMWRCISGFNRKAGFVE